MELIELKKSNVHIIVEYLPNASHIFNANEQFKMISTVIKSGYEV